MKTSATPRFSRDTIEFLKKAGRQKKADWLDKNESEYERVLKAPLTHMARTVAAEIGPLAPDYHFPLKGLGRVKRTALSAEQNGSPFKDWITYSAARPRESRFEHNPNLFFLINSEDPKDPVLVAGGLYMPSSRQTRAMRAQLAKDASAFEALFATKAFKQAFPGGFSDEKISSRPTRGYDPNHPRMHLLRLQAFFVWKPYPMKVFASKDFAQVVAADFKQILRMNRLIEDALTGRLEPVAPPQKAAAPAQIMERLKGLDEVPRRRTFDF